MTCYNSWITGGHYKQGNFLLETSLARPLTRRWSHWHEEFSSVSQWSTCQILQLLQKRATIIERDHPFCNGWQHWRTEQKDSPSNKNLFQEFPSKTSHTNPITTICGWPCTSAYPWPAVFQSVCWLLGALSHPHLPWKVWNIPCLLAEWLRFELSAEFPALNGRLQPVWTSSQPTTARNPQARRPRLPPTWFTRSTNA